ncbi:hypothetical protein BDB01DRAFT_815772 [Pilobolus umbonatus]|nr:hypothetical protein BDB01DRAFT_815772 [Pilobolus umbonatus]
MRTPLPYILLFLFYLHAGLADQVTTGYKTFCGYLESSIFCAGNFNEYYNASADMIYLRLENFVSISTTEIKTRWERESYTNNIDAQRRQIGQFVAIPGNSQMIFQGGTDSQDEKPFQVVTVNEGRKASWSSMEDYKIPNVPVGQIRLGTVSYARSINKLVFYGGLTEVPINHSAVLDGVTYSTLSDNNDLLPFGFSKLTTYDLLSQQWVEIANQSGTYNENFIYGLHSVAVPEGDAIYFIGGSDILKQNTSIKRFIGFNTVYQVNIPSYQWETLTCTGAPDNRDYYTTTMLPDGNTVMIYGGRMAESEFVFDDYTQICYLLDLTTYEWRSCNLQLSADLNPSRFHHSAVVVENHLFIMFGFTSIQHPLDSILVFDVSDPHNIHYESEYTYVKPNITVPPESLEDIKDGLGGGAIAGIVIGCVVAVSLIIGAIWFMLKKRREDSIQDFPADWDEIDKGFNVKTETEGSTTVIYGAGQSTPTGLMKPIEIE